MIHTIDSNPPQLDASICRDYLRSSCSRGKKCKFRHPSLAECENLKISFSGPNICREHLAGQCQRQFCKYLHVAASIEDSAQSSTESNVSISQPAELYNCPPFCKDFIKGNCRRGNACKYKHISAKEKNLQTQFLKQHFAGRNSQPTNNLVVCPAQQTTTVLPVTTSCPPQQVFIQIDSSGQIPTATPTPIITPAPATLIHSQNGATTTILQPAHLIQPPQQPPVFVENAIFTSRATSAIPVMVATNSPHHINQVPAPTGFLTQQIQNNSNVVNSEMAQETAGCGDGSPSADPSSSSVVSGMAASAAMAAASAIVQSAARGDTSLLSCSSTIQKLMPELFKVQNTNNTSQSNKSTNENETNSEHNSEETSLDSSEPSGVNMIDKTTDSNLNVGNEEPATQSADGTQENEKPETEQQLQLRSSMALTAATVAVVAAAAAFEHHQQSKKNKKLRQKMPQTNAQNSIIHHSVVPASSAAEMGNSTSAQHHLLLPISSQGGFVTTATQQQPLQLAAMQRFAAADANRKHRQAQLEQELHQADEELFFSRATNLLSPQPEDEEEFEDEEDLEHEIANFAARNHHNSKRRKMEMVENAEEEDEDEDDEKSSPGSREEEKMPLSLDAKDSPISTSSHSLENHGVATVSSTDVPTDKPSQRTTSTTTAASAAATRKRHNATNQNMVNLLRYTKRKHKAELLRMKFKIQGLMRENSALRAKNQMFMEQNIRLRQSSKQAVEAAKIAETAAAQIISLDPPKSHGRFFMESAGSAIATAASSSNHILSTVYSPALVSCSMPSLTSSCTSPITFTVNHPSTAREKLQTHTVSGTSESLLPPGTVNLQSLGSVSIPGGMNGSQTLAFSAVPAATLQTVTMTSPLAQCVTASLPPSSQAACQNGDLRILQPASVASQARLTYTPFVQYSN